MNEKVRKKSLMAEIIPFAGLHYNPERVPLDKVIAPPYDVLSPEQQKALYEIHSDNFVRIMLNREETGDGESRNRYTRAADCLNEWLSQGILVQDEIPALYEYIQRFEHPNESTRIVERKTLFVALKLEPYEKGVILPHEETHPKAKADRLQLMRATQANPEPIYGLYEDPSHEAAQMLEQARGSVEPFLTAALSGKSGARTEEHIIYRHADAAVIKEVSAFLSSRRIWIADGHHRYETALNYQREQRERAAPDTTASQPYDYLLIGLSAFEDPGLVVLPTHRLVKNISANRLEALALQLDRFFIVQETTIETAREWIKREAPGQKRFAILRAEGALCLILRDLKLAESAAEDTHCEAWRRLDVTILQTLVLDRTLGISWTELAHTADVAYTRDEEEAVHKVASGEFQLACLLQNPTVNEVRDVASAGDKMPQKSTFFYPKLWSGLILRSLR